MHFQSNLWKRLMSFQKKHHIKSAPNENDKESSYHAFLLSKTGVGDPYRKLLFMLQNI